MTTQRWKTKNQFMRSVSIVLVFSLICMEIALYASGVQSRPTAETIAVPRNVPAPNQAGNRSGSQTTESRVETNLTEDPPEYPMISRRKFTIGGIIASILVGSTDFLLNRFTPLGQWLGRYPEEIDLLDPSQGQITISERSLAEWGSPWRLPETVTVMIDTPRYIIVVATEN